MQYSKTQSEVCLCSHTSSPQANLKTHLGVLTEIIRPLTSQAGSKCSTANQQITKTQQQPAEGFSPTRGESEGRFSGTHHATAICFVLRQTATFHNNPRGQHASAVLPSRPARPLRQPAQCSVSSWHVSFSTRCPSPEHWSLQTASAQHRESPAQDTTTVLTLHSGSPQHCSELTGLPQESFNLGEKQAILSTYQTRAHEG